MKFAYHLEFLQDHDEEEIPLFYIYLLLWCDIHTNVAILYTANLQSKYTAKCETQILGLKA